MTREEIRNIITKYSSFIYRICLNFTQNTADAENLTQETFILAYTHSLPSDENACKAYLTKIAVNKCKDYLKSAYMKRVLLDPELSFISQKSTSMGIPEKILMEKESLKTIKEHILSLNEPYRNVSILYFLKEKQIREIAEILNRPPNTVSTQLFRAKIILKEKLTKGKEDL